LPGAAPLYVEGELIRLLGDTISLGITYAPVLDSRNRPANIVANVRDLSRQREEEQLQKTFISVVSHELKTPVSIIKGFAGTLGHDEARWTPSQIKEYASVIEEEADRLTDLIDNLLEASRLQSGTFRLDISDEVDLQEMAESTIRKFEAQTQSHTFYLEFPEDFPVVCADERRLTQVFNNLISNAIKYSPEGGQIKILGHIQGDYVTVSIQDHGIGIHAMKSTGFSRNFLDSITL